jgi:hypothetical protein
MVLVCSVPKHSNGLVCPINMTAFWMNWSPQAQRYFKKIPARASVRSKVVLTMVAQRLGNGSELHVVWGEGPGSEDSRAEWHSMYCTVCTPARPPRRRWKMRRKHLHWGLHGGRKHVRGLTWTLSVLPLQACFRFRGYDQALVFVTQSPWDSHVSYWRSASVS